jgi:uncharacterized protein (TIGR03437 family)
VFPDVDGQTVATAIRTIKPSGSQAGAFARAGGQAYGPVNVQFVQFNPDGTVNHVLSGVSQTPWFGMWGNPVSGHILTTTGQGQLIDIDPLANGGLGTSTVIATPGTGYDGVGVSPDGTIVYVVQTDHIVGYNISTHAQVFDSGLLAGQPDGVAVISSANSALNGKILINFNGLTINAGFVGLLDPVTKVLTTIASGGSRGDYVSPDPADGSAFLSYSDVVYRISCGANCSIGQTSGRIDPPGGGSGVISTIAGNGVGGFAGDGGSAANSALNSPQGVAVDKAGNVYIADMLNSRVRKVDVAGNMSTVAGCGVLTTACILAGLGDGGPATTPMLYPFDVATDSAGNFYIADDGNNRIRKVDGNAILSTVAGSNKSGFSGDNGPAINAFLNGPLGMAFDSAGNLYFADLSNERIRKVSVSGIITTVAGNGTHGFSGDGGPAIAAALAHPHSVAVDGAGNLYITDSENFRVRKVNTSGIITTIAGTGGVGFTGDGGPATAATLTTPWGIAVDGSGNIYFSDWLNNRVRKIDGNGIITTVAGGGSSLGDGGSATSAKLFGPTGIALDASGNLYIADTSNNRIRKVTPAPAGPPVITGVVNGASFQTPIVPNSWATITGSNLAAVTDTWANAIVNGKLPTVLDGVSVTVGGKPAYLYYISAGQLNIVVPDIPAGQTQVTVTTAAGTSSAFTVTAATYGPAFFLWPNNQAVATRQNFSLAVKDGTFAGATTIAAKPGDVIILWGTGFGPTNPAAPVGIQLPSDQVFSTSTAANVTINNVPATVFGTALAPGFAALYQIAIQVPDSTPDGEWPVIVSIGGVKSPTGVVLSVKK